MNAIRMTAVVGAFALLTSAAQAQGLLSQLFSGPQNMYSVGHTNGAYNANGSCNTGICGPNGCYTPGAGSTPYLGVNSPLQPYSQNGVNHLRPDYNHPGYQLPGNAYSGNSGYGQYGVGRPQMNFPFSNSGSLNHQSARPERTPGSSFNHTPNVRPELDWQFNNPMFSRVNNNPSALGWSMPTQQNGWLLH